jgi:hypothetical protein
MGMLAHRDSVFIETIIKFSPLTNCIKHKAMLGLGYIQYLSWDGKLLNSLFFLFFYGNRKTSQDRKKEHLTEDYLANRSCG